MSLEEKMLLIKDETDRLLQYANNTTGEADSTLGDAVKRLADGYGGGGGDTLRPVYTEEFTLNEDYTSTALTNVHSAENLIRYIAEHYKTLGLNDNAPLPLLIEISLKTKTSDTIAWIQGCKRLIYSFVFYSGERVIVYGTDYGLINQLNNVGSEFAGGGREFWSINPAKSIKNYSDVYIAFRASSVAVMAAGTYQIKLYELPGLKPIWGK